MQTPAPVDYARATSVEHALELLEKLGPESRLIAGGHSLLPMMRIRLAQPECVIDINGLTDLDYVRVEGGDLCIGAMTRHSTVLASPVVGEHYAIFHDAEERVLAVWAIEIAGGEVTSISSIVNPDKLAHLGPVGDFGAVLRSAR